MTKCDNIYPMLEKFLYKTLKRPPKLFVRYDIRPKNEKITIVFLHGIAVDARFWCNTISKIENIKAFNHTRIIALDLLGEGNSPAPDWLEYTMNDHVGAIKKTLRKLRIVTPLIIVGHSMGGILATNYAMNNKVDKLMLVCTPLMPAVTDRNFLDKFNKMSIKMIGNLATKNPALYTTAKLMHALSVRKSYDVNKNAFRKTLKNVVMETDSLANIQKLSIPIYLLRGMGDVFSNPVNYHELSKRKNISVWEVPLSGHQIRGPLMTAVLKRLSGIIRG